MASQLDSLVDAITELVIRELESAGTSQPSEVVPTPPRRSGSGPRILIAPGPTDVDKRLWKVLADREGVCFSALAWNGFRKDQLPAAGTNWGLETRTTAWSKVVANYRGVCLLGADLSVLGSVAQLGAGNLPPAGVAIAAIAAGIPVFLDEHQFEQLRRHSARLPGGFVRRFEELWRIVASFGVEIGGPEALSSFLAKCSGKGGSTGASRSGGRDVVTVEDVEAARRAGHKCMSVAVGSIVTPLAYQRASEWGVEVKFQ